MKLDVKKTYIIFAAILIIFFIACIINIDNEIPGHDEATYYYQGKLILNPDLYYLCQNDPQHCDIYPPKAVHTYTDHPPFAKYIFAFALLFNDSLVSGRVLMIFFGLGVLLFTYLLTRKMYSEKIALLATALAAISLPVVNLSRVIYADMPLMLFILASIYFFYIGFKEKPKYLLLGGFFAGLAMLTKFPGIFVIFPVAYMFLRYGIKFKGSLGNMSLDVKLADEKLLNILIVSVLIWFFVGFLIYNLITISLYGFLSFERTLAYQQASGRTELADIDILGFLGSVNHIIPLLPIFVIGVCYLAARRKPEDLVVLISLIFFSLIPIMSKDYVSFFNVASPSQYYVPVAVFAAITLAVFLEYVWRKIPSKPLFIVLGILALAQVWYFSPLYFEYQGHKEDMPVIKRAIAILETKVNKTEPVLTTYNGLGLRFVYGFEYTYMIDGLKSAEIKQAIEQNKITSHFYVIFDRDWQQTVRFLGEICPRDDVIIDGETIFYVYRC